MTHSMVSRHMRCLLVKEATLGSQLVIQGKNSQTCSPSSLGLEASPVAEVKYRKY